MIIYCDGSTFHFIKPAEIEKYGKDKISISWGIKIEEGEYGVELMGQRVLPIKYAGSHEIIAFIEAVIYAVAHNGNTLNTVFYTDYMNVTDATKPTFGSYAELGTAMQMKKFKAKIKSFMSWVSDLYSKETLEIVEQFLIFARIKWVKGHSGCVNNHRADYLARHAHQVAMGRGVTFQQFEEWLHRGESLYTPAIKKNMMPIRALIG